MTTSEKVRLMYRSIAIISLVLLSSCDNSPRDAKLRDVFFANESDFNKLVSMSQQDRAVVRISPSLMLLQTDSGTKKNEGLSVDRLQEYRVLFKKLGLAEGLERPKAFPSAVLFYAYCEGSAINADCKGFAYSEKPLSPVATSLDKPHAEGDLFKPLCPNWYLFRWVS